MMQTLVTLAIVNHDKDHTMKHFCRKNGLKNSMKCSRMKVTGDGKKLAYYDLYITSNEYKSSMSKSTTDDGKIRNPNIYRQVPKEKPTPVYNNFMTYFNKLKKKRTISCCFFSSGNI